MKTNQIVSHDEFAMMYGTTAYGINVEGKIIHLESQQIVVDPWISPIDPRRPLKLKGMDGLPLNLTLPQLMLYTYCGRCDAEVGLFYPDEPPTLANCRYMSALEIDKCVPGEKMYICGDEFRRCGVTNRTGNCAYINSRGCVISVTHNYAGQLLLEYGRWVYRDGYPASLVPGATRPVHLLVWDAWGNHTRSYGFDVHHKDQCRWNPAITNLELLTKSEHQQRHAQDGRVIKPYRYTEREVRFVCERLENDMPLTDIASELAKLNGGRYTSASNFINRLRRGGVMPNVVSEYHVENYSPRYGHRHEYPASQVHEVCRLLSTTQLSDLAIARQTGMNDHAVRYIRRGEIDHIPDPKARAIIAEYAGKIDPSVHCTGRFTRKLTREQIEWIVDKRQRTNWSHAEIGDIIGCASEVVRSIANGTPPYDDVGPVECAFTEKERRSRARVSIELPEDDPRVVAIRARMKKF